MHKTLTLLFLFVSWFTFSQSLSDLVFGGEGSFEVVTWNLEFFPKNNQTTIDSTSVAMAAMQADVYALQEINDEEAFQDLANSLEDYTGYIIPNNYNNLILAYLVHKDVEVISHNSILNSNQYSYNFAGRPPYLIELSFSGMTFYIINIHLKCCGDGTLDESDSGDEETRRRAASNAIKYYIDNNLADKNVLLVGDYNDLIEDNISNNVFQSFIDDSDNYLFADTPILDFPTSQWSFPSWPSHLDHILITNELFDEFNNAYNYVTTMNMAQYFSNGFYGYDNCISDHLPVGIRLWPYTSNIDDQKIKPKQLKEIRNIEGKRIESSSNQLQFLIYENGSVEKNITLD